MSQNTSTLAGGDESNNKTEETADPRQLVLPHVDTAIDLANGRFPFKITIPSLFMGIPSVGALAASIWYIYQGSPGVGVGLIVLSSLLGMMALGGRMASMWSSYPHEKVIDGFKHLRRRLTLPWSYDTAVSRADELHAIKHPITVDTNDKTYAGVMTHDGRAVIPVPLEGSNTEFLDSGILPQLTASFTQGVDSEITAGVEPISFYSTTRPAESQVATEYQSRAHATISRLTDYLSGLIGETGEWVAERDAETGANDTYHYLVITASEDSAGNKALKEDLTHRLGQAEAAMSKADSVTPGTLTSREAVNLAGEYWDRTAYPEGDVGDSAAEAAVPSHNVGDLPDGFSSPTPAERAIAPEWFDERIRHVEVGETVARTYWISNWPEQPPAKFLHGLYTMPGVDLDVKIFGHPKPRDSVISDLEKIIPRIDAEGMDRAENMDVTSLTIDDDLSAYVLAYKLLQEVDTEPWGLSGYVTVRAPDTEKLRKACERVEKELKRAPTRCTPSAPFGDQMVAFRSAGPYCPDRYASKGDVRRRATKTHLALGGVFGAALPAATPETSEEGGIRWGRDATTMRTIQKDPFQSGMAPHLTTVAPSGSGKSFAVKQASQEWWMNGENRTLIYCDTQGEFEDTVEGFGGEHIVIDGKTGINPLDIRPAASHDRAATGDSVNQYRLKVTEATEFFKGIIRSHDVDPSKFHARLEQAIERTYQNAGITPDPSTHGRPSPDPDDLFETLEDMMENPGDYTFTDVEAEKQPVEEQVAELHSQLSGFQPGGKYHNILTDSTDTLTPDIDMAYLDMRQLAGQTDGAESANLQLAVSQVSQIIKQTDGETIFVIDEAHNLLHSPEMVDWLNKAAREWRRYDAALWFVTQSPEEFVSHAGEHGTENKRKTILEQCSTVQILKAPRVDAETLEKFGLPKHHADTVQKDLVPGSDDEEDYSECLISFQNERGWIRTQIEASPALGASIDFTHRTGKSYVEYMREALDDIADDEDATDDDDTEPVVSPGDGTPPGALATDGGDER